MPTFGEIGNLGSDLWFVALGAILLATGSAALVLPAIHRPARNLSLAAFGMAVVLYGARVLAGLTTFRAVVPTPDIVWDYVDAFCTYLLPVAVFVFADHSWGRGWYGSVHRIWQIHLGYAVVAIMIDLALGSPAAARGPNGPLVVLWMATVLVNLWQGQLKFRPEDRIVRVGLVVLVLLIANDNLVALSAVPWSLRGESVGVAVFVACLGYALALRTLGNERRLATLDYELRTARQIQQSLLPRELPATRDGALAVRYLPMAAVGGDLYDYLQIDDHGFGVLVADVTGHGIPAALIASMVKTAAAAQVRVANQPSAVMAGMNRDLCGQVDGHYVTAVYIYVDLITGSVSMANAGHPPPLLLLGAGREAREAGESGLMLGFLPDAEFPTVTFTPSSGDRLVLYTDGVVEATSPGGDFFEIDRLRQTLVEHSPLSPERWADHLLEELARWRGTPELELDDDLTLVVLDLPDAKLAPSSEAPATKARTTTV